MKNYLVSEVFTPCLPADKTFVERESISNQLKRALNTPGKQIILFGNSGVGKTTLLSKKLKLHGFESITTHCIKGMTLESIVIDAFNQLDTFYTSIKEKEKQGELKGSIAANYFGIKAKIEALLNERKTHTHKRAVELPITPQTLATYFGEANKCWIIEDFHKIIREDKQQMAQIMKVFMDRSAQFPNLKIIAVGAVNTAREVVQYDPEMQNRISEVFIPLMSEGNLHEIIEIGSELLNIKFEKTTQDKIISYSSGLPSITHQLCLLVCEQEKIIQTFKGKLPKNISTKSLDNAMTEYLHEYSDTMKSTYDLATVIRHDRKYENPKELLNAILNYPKHENVTLKEVEKIIKKDYPEYNGSNLRKYLDELTSGERGEILRYDKNSDSYSFSTPFLKAYSHCMKDSYEKEVVNKTRLVSDLQGYLKKELEIARAVFEQDYRDAFID